MARATEIKNAKGEAIVLNDAEDRLVRYNQERINALGYDVNITTLTGITKQVTEQKFYRIKPSEYLPIAVGNGAFSQELLTYRSYKTGGDFESGLINTGTANARTPRADLAIDTVTVPINSWKFEIGWDLFELQFAAKNAMLIDLVTEKEIARKTEWDLGIQKVAFVGLTTDPNVYGLLTQPDVNSNTGLITNYINALDAADFNTLLGGIMGAYQTNCNFTAMPTHFIIPQLDYNGLIDFPDATYPLKNKLTLMQEAFAAITMNPNFKILPAAYADESQNVDVSGLDKNRYTLLNYDPRSLRMDIPVDYTGTMANTLEGFTYQNVGYGQFTGAKAYRPLEMLYFDWAS